MEFRSVESSHGVVVDDTTGLPIAFAANSAAGDRHVRIRTVLECEVGGTEQRSPTGGIEYRDTIRCTESARTGDVQVEESPEGRTLRVPVRIGGVVGHVLCRFNRAGPALSLGFDFVGVQNVVVRNVVLRADLELGGGGWSITAPGNGIAGATPLEVLTAEAGISPLGGLRGSSGLVHLEPIDDRQQATTIWFDNDVEIPEIGLRGSSCSSLSSLPASAEAAARGGSNENSS